MEKKEPLSVTYVDVDTVIGMLNENLPKVMSKLVPQSKPKMTTILYSNRVILPPFPPLGEGGEGGRGGPNFVVTLASKHFTKCTRLYLSDFLPTCGYEQAVHPPYQLFFFDFFLLLSLHFSRCVFVTWKRKERILILVRGTCA